MFVFPLWNTIGVWSLFRCPPGPRSCTWAAPLESSAPGVQESMFRTIPCTRVVWSWSFRIRVNLVILWSPAWWFCDSVMREDRPSVQKVIWKGDPPSSETCSEQKEWISTWKPGENTWKPAGRVIYYRAAVLAAGSVSGCPSTHWLNHPAEETQPLTWTVKPGWPAHSLPIENLNGCLQKLCPAAQSIPVSVRFKNM